MQPDPSYEYREIECSTYAQVEAQRLGGWELYDIQNIPGGYLVYARRPLEETP